MMSVLVLIFIIQISTKSLTQGNAQYSETNACRIDQLKAECQSDVREVKEVLSSVPKNVTALSITLHTDWPGDFLEPPNIADITPISHLVNLEILEIIGDYTVDHNINLTYDKYTFAGLVKLRNLVINIPLGDGSLGNIVNYTPLLDVLDLTNTHHLGLSTLAVLMSDVNLTSLKALKISNFQTIGVPGFNSTINITALFHGQIAQKVTHLDISKNYIGLLTPSYIKTLPNLKFLDVSFNMLIAFPNNMFALEATLHPVLEVLNMTNQGDFRKVGTKPQQQQHQNRYRKYNPMIHKHVRTVVVNCINANDNRNISNTLHNNAMFCKISFCVIRNVTVTETTWRLASEIPCSVFSTPAELVDFKCLFGLKLPLFRKYKIVLWNDVNYNMPDGYNLSRKLCISPSPLQEIGFANNEQWVKGLQFSKTINNVQFTGLDSLHSVDLSENGLRLFVPLTGIGCRDLRKINLAGNQVRINSQDNCQIWPNLTHINLARNNISSIPKIFFKSCHNLKNVDLSGNTLNFATVTFKFPVKSSLQFLNLSNNQIEIIPASFVEQLEMIDGTLNTTLTLDITHNPLVCNCRQDAIQFIHWLHVTNITLVKRDTLICSSKYGFTLAHNIDLNKLQNECFPSNLITIVTSVMSTVSSIAVILIFFMIHHYRWRIRKKMYDTQKWLLSSRCFKSEESNNDQLQQKLWKYDAFVSYCAIDRFWVHDVLMRQLENVYGFKLCIHYRDFRPGEVIVDEIVRNIRDSRKLIIILSDVSITRPWCQFELEVAMREAINRNTKIIIIKLDMNDFIPQDSTLVRVLETQVYLEWCEKVEGQKLFWAKLVDLLYGSDDDGCSPLNCCRSGMAAIEPDDIIQVYDNDDARNNADNDKLM